MDLEYKDSICYMISSHPWQLHQKHIEILTLYLAFIEIKAWDILRSRKYNNHLSEKMGAESGDTESRMEEKQGK